MPAARPRIREKKTPMQSPCSKEKPIRTHQLAYAYCTHQSHAPAPKYTPTSDSSTTEHNHYSNMTNDTSTQTSSHQISYTVYFHATTRPRADEAFVRQMQKAHEDNKARLRSGPLAPLRGRRTRPVVGRGRSGRDSHVMLIHRSWREGKRRRRGVLVSRKRGIGHRGGGN